MLLLINEVVQSEFLVWCLGIGLGWCGGLFLRVGLCCYYTGLIVLLRVSGRSLVLLTLIVGLVWVV